MDINKKTLPGNQYAITGGSKDRNDKKFLSKDRDVR